MASTSYGGPSLEQVVAEAYVSPEADDDGSDNHKEAGQNRPGGTRFSDAKPPLGNLTKAMEGFGLANMQSFGHGAEASS